MGAWAPHKLIFSHGWDVASMMIMLLNFVIVFLLESVFLFSVDIRILCFKVDNSHFSNTCY